MMKGINFEKALQKKKNQKIVKDEVPAIKKSNKRVKVEKSKVQKVYPKSEYIIVHTGKKEVINPSKGFRSSGCNEPNSGSYLKIKEDIAEVKPEINVIHLDDTPIPHKILYFPKISLNSNTNKMINNDISNLDFAAHNNNHPETKSIALFQSEIPLISIDKIPKCGGKFGKMRVYSDNSAELEVNGVMYEISPLMKQNMEIFQISPHPSEVAFEMSSIGKVSGQFRIDLSPQDDY